VKTSESSERVLVTGALGCIGAWTVRVLLDDGATVVAYDAGEAEHRLAQVVPFPPADRLVRVTGDVRDQGALERAMDEHGVSSVIHLAGLQVPACRSAPVLGAEVNVVGTVTVFEAVRARRERVGPVVYASSVAAYGGHEDDVGPDAELGGHAQTLYGVYKRANEGCARVYWEDAGVGSVGLRPYVVYGPGRDQGVTSEPTLAMLAAARGEPFHITYGGFSHMQYAEDVARSFVAAARSGHQGAAVVNLAGSVVDMREVVAAIEAAVPEARGRISFGDAPLPFPGQVDTTNDVLPSQATTPLEEGVRRTVGHFRRMLADQRTASLLTGRPQE
jgi:UDP-glucuronate 4-epimerase